MTQVASTIEERPAVKRLEPRKVFEVSEWHKKKRVAAANNIDPLMKEVFALLDSSKYSYQHVAHVSGFDVRCLRAWKRKHCPKVSTLRAVLNVLGYDLQIVPLKIK